MNVIIPRIDQMYGARTNADRAAWLLSCPFDVLLSCEMTVRNHLRSVGFREGVAYLELELSELRRERQPDADQSFSMEVKAARGRMERVALGLPPTRL
jgi:hypothetical protein